MAAPLLYCMFVHGWQQAVSIVHCKKVRGFPVPSRDVTGHCHSPWPGIMKLFTARESLVSDIPAVDGKTANLFLQCSIVQVVLVT
jgi:hypothetical protein